MQSTSLSNQLITSQHQLGIANNNYQTLLKGVETVKNYAIFVLDIHGRVLTWNKGAEAIKGYLAQDIIGQPMAKFYKSEAIAQCFPEHALEEAKAQGKFEDENWRVRKDGTFLWANVVITAIYDENQAHIGFVNVTCDLTQRNRVEIELAKSERNYRTLASLAPVGIFHCNTEGHLTYANETACKIMGLSLTDALGEGWLEAIHPDDKQAVITQWRQAIQKGITFKLEYRFYRPTDKHVTWVISQARPELDEEQHVKSYVQTITEINERKMLERTEQERLVALERLEEEQRKRLQEADNNRLRLEEYIDTICHEIRNPLNGIFGCVDGLTHTINYLESFLERYEKVLSWEIGNALSTQLAELKEVLANLQVCSEQQRVIVDDVLDLSKLENNRVALRIEPFSPKQAILAALQIFQQALTHKQLELLLDLPEDFYVRSDDGRFTQILINLLSNAIKFTSEGSITVTLSQQVVDDDKREIEVHIKDTGLGIHKNERAHLFERFSQTDESIADRFGGTGLGLAICKKLVTLMGGTISVNSQRGHGSDFYFTITAPPAPQPILALTEQRRTSLSPEMLSSVPRQHILIVEDNTINQKVLAKHLKEAGHSYKIAANGLEALNMYREHAFDMVFMDIEMPVMGGLEATRQLRLYELQNQQARVYIVGLSGNARPEQVDTALQIGMDAYITKPYHKDTLLKHIRQAVTQSVQVVPQTPLLMKTLNLHRSNTPLFFPVSPTKRFDKYGETFQQCAQILLEDGHPFTVQVNKNQLIIELLPHLPIRSALMCKLLLKELKEHLQTVFKLDSKDILLTETALQLNVLKQYELIHQVLLDSGLSEKVLSEPLMRLR